MAGRVERATFASSVSRHLTNHGPCSVLTRGSAIEYLSRVTVAPITSSIRDVPSEVVVGPEDGLKQPSAVNLHNLLTIEQTRLGRRVAQLSEATMRDVCRAIGFALGCEQ